MNAILKELNIDHKLFLVNAGEVKDITESATKN